MNFDNENVSVQGIIDEIEKEDNLKKKKPPKTLLINLSLMILSIFILAIILFILGEIALRLFPIYLDVLFIGDKFMGYKHIPNKEGQYYSRESGAIDIKINQEGFRDVEHNVENIDNKYRIVFLGDSFTDAIQVDFEKIFHQQLQKDLNGTYPGKFEIFNFGIGAFSTAQEYLSYKNYAKKYNPDLVIVMFFVNDALDNCCEDSFKPCYNIKDGEIKQVPFTPRIHNDFKLFIGEYFKTIVFLREKYYKIKRIKVVKEDIERDGILDQNKIFLKEYDSKLKECWEISNHFFKKLKEDVENDGAKLKVFIIPHPASIYERHKIRLLEENTILSESFFDFDKPYREIDKILNKEEIDYIHLIEFLKDYDEELYFFRDGHFNEKGHKIVSEIIFENLEKEGIVKTRES